MYNLDLFKEREEFRIKQIKLIILMLVHDTKKDSLNLCSRVLLYIIRKGYFIYKKIKLKKRNKLV